MVDTIEVQTELGIFVLAKPKAGARNRAMIKAESDSGVIRRVVFTTELLPRIISKRPESLDQEMPIEHILDSMSLEDYDKLVEAADTLATPASSTPEEQYKKKTSSTDTSTKE